MLILTITDLHGRPIDACLNIEAVDLALVLGDVTTGEGLSETAKRVEALKNVYPMLYAIPGNWELPDSIRWLTQEGLSLDGKTARFEDLLLFGVGGSIPTPFNTPNETTEEELERRLALCPLPEKDERLILLSHNPPYEACDRVLLGHHVGSKSVRKFIQERSPDLVLCGHIHEGRGIENLGKTIVINPGPAPKNYALIRIEKEISVTLAQT